MSAKVWIDGRFHDKLDARVSAFDHGVLFGDGVTAAMRIYSGHPFRLAAYIDRLFRAASDIALSIPGTPAELREVVLKTVGENRRTEGFVRILVTRGAGTLSLDPRKCDPCVVVIAEDVVPYPRELYDSGLDVVVVPTTRPPLHSLDQGPLVRAKVAALKVGCLDAILCDASGAISGATDAAVFAAIDGALHTPPIESGPDPETAQFVQSLASEIGLQFHERPISKGELRPASELFLAGQSGEVIAVRSVDGQPIGSGGEGPTTRRLRTLYRDAVRRL